MIRISIFLISFLIYLSSVPSTVFWGSSAEMSTASYSLTIPHPSGYPAFLVLGKLFTFLPVGDVAFRINILNSFVGAFSALLFFSVFSKIMIEFFKSPIKIIPIFTTFCFVLSYSILWFVTIEADRFILHIFFALLSFLFFLNVYLGNLKSLFLLFFSLGLGLSNQISYLIFALLIVIFIIIKIRKEQFFKKSFVFLVFLILLPINLFILIPIRDIESTISKSPKHFIKYIKRDDIDIWKVVLYKYPLREIKRFFIDKDYFICIGEKEEFFSDGGILGKVRMSKLILQTIISLYSLLKEYGIFSIFSIMGFYFLWRKSKELSLFTLFWFILYFIIPVLYLNLFTWNISNYHKFSNLKIIPYTIWFGCGLLLLYKLFDKNKYLIYFQKFLLIGMILVPIFIFKIQQPFLDNFKNTDTRKFCKTIFSTLPPKSILLINDTDIVSVLKYYQLVEKKREDIIIVGKQYLFNPWFQENLIKKGILDKIYNIRISTKEGSYKGISDIVSKIIASNKNIFAIYEHPMIYFFKREKLPEKLCFPIKSIKDFNLQKFEKD